MERVDSYPALSALASRYLRRGVCANTMVSREVFGPAIEEGRLSVHAGPDNLLFLEERGGHTRLSFYLNDLSVPLEAELPRPVVAEIAYRPQDVYLQRAAEYLRGQGFELLFHRVRMSRAAGGAEDVSGVGVADKADFAATAAFLNENFPLLTGCLPTAAELERDLEQGRILLRRDGKGVAALLHFAPEGKAFEIRHLAVREDLRGRGLAKELIGAFLRKIDGVRSQVWFREGYLAAREAYAALGFAPDGRRSAVLCLNGKEGFNP